MTQQISRRNIAKGAAWATPAILASSAIPAYAASTDRSSKAPYGSICSLFFGGGTVNAQRTDINLAVISSHANGIIRKGETVTWVITAPDANGAPKGNYAQDGGWSIQTSGSRGNFVVTLVTTRDVPVREVNCIAKVVWDSSSSSLSTAVRPKSQVTVRSASSDGSTNLTFTVPQRFGTSVNDSRRAPLIINGQCYPTIQWSNLGNSTNLNKDNILLFNGSRVLPDSNAGNDQLITSGIC